MKLKLSHHCLWDCSHVNTSDYDAKLLKALNTICHSLSNLTDIKLHIIYLVSLWLYQYQQQIYIRDYMCEFLNLVTPVVCIILQNIKLCVFIEYCLGESLPSPALSNTQHLILLNQQYKSFIIKLLYVFNYLI